ncbi:MAG TPA: hypothetical protein VFK85_06795 [Anaeromyxobacteraceae bacterium]|nr:hypothetical protein [Anaeromyxobacteraceae bacterium]
MHKRTMRYGGGLFLAAVLALAGCSGNDGAAGAQGPAGPAGSDGTDGTNGTNGTNGKDLTAAAKPESCSTCHSGVGAEHQAIYNRYVDPTKLTATIDEVTSTANAGADAGTYNVVVKFTLKKNGVVLTDADYAALGQKRFSGTKFVAKTATTPANFDTATSMSFGTPTFDATAGQFTVAAAKAKFDPTATDSFLYFYFADAPIIPSSGHYFLPENTVSVAKVFGTIEYVSAANVSACEACHGKEYAKHGYRQAKVAGLPDMVACKACHTDQRVGSDHEWQVLADNPLQFATTGVTASDRATKYAYVATVMNDTHMSHAMEFAYPQSMANCVTCHKDKLGDILTDANFNITTCKSCHPVTGVGGTEATRAPALKTILSEAIHGNMDLYGNASGCNVCHKAGGIAPTFSKIHTGYNAAIYDNAGAKFSASFKTKVDSASFDSATNKLTVNFSVEGAAANAIVKPTLVVSLYGYDTKDFIVSGHSSQFTDKTPNLEWSEGAVIRGTTTPAATNRLVVAPATATAGNTQWTVTADLTTWKAMLADGTVKRAEIAFLPTVGRDQTKVVSATNPAIAVPGIAQTYDLVAKALVADTASYGKDIVAVSKCNACHDALGTTFHGPNYGSAGVVGCRLCHVAGVGGGHLEMQSRSIDSYVHAIHRMQVFDVGTVDFSDPVAAMRYTHHTESTYPNFTILSCESCHNPGKYDVPDQSKSLPGVLSASAAFKGDRAIGTVGSVVVGPASRACGSCHRAGMINEDDAGKLASFNAHAASFGTQVDATPGAFDAAVAKIMALFK